MASLSPWSERKKYWLPHGKCAGPGKLLRGIPVSAADEIYVNMFILAKFNGSVLCNNSGFKNSGLTLELSILVGIERSGTIRGRIPS